MAPPRALSAATIHPLYLSYFPWLATVAVDGQSPTTATCMWFVRIVSIAPVRAWNPRNRVTSRHITRPNIPHSFHPRIYFTLLFEGAALLMHQIVCVLFCLGRMMVLRPQCSTAILLDHVLTSSSYLKISIVPTCRAAELDCRG